MLSHLTDYIPSAG